MKIFFIIVTALAAIWSAAWGAAHHFSGRALDNWIAREKQQGREWSCAERSAGGFPLAYRLDCASPQLFAQAPGGTRMATLKSLSATYTVTSPTTASIVFGGPLEMRQPGNSGRLEANWSELRLEISGLPSREPVAQLRGRDVAILRETMEPDSQTYTIKQFDGRFAPRRLASGSPAIAIDIEAQGVAARELDRALGNTEPAQISGKFVLSHFRTLTAGPVPARLERWRSSGGALEILDMKASKGRLALDTSGTLNIDPQRRATGKLDARATGLASLLEKFGFPGVGARGGLLGGLLRGRAPAPEQEPAPRPIPLPLVLRDGFVWLGPLRTPLVLPPLY